MTTTLTAWASFSKDLPQILALDPVCDEAFYQQQRKHRETTISKVTSEHTRQLLGLIVYTSLSDRFEVKRLLANRFPTTFQKLISQLVHKLQRDRRRSRLLLHFYETADHALDLQQQQLLRAANFNVIKQVTDNYGTFYVFELVDTKDVLNSVERKP